LADITPEGIGALLATRHPGVHVTDVTVVDQTEGSASRLRLDVDYAPGCAAGLPRRLFVKRNLPEFGFPAEMYSTEIRYYRDLLPELSFEQPEVYGIEHVEGTTRFMILMEDLSQRPGVRIGIATTPVGADDVAGLLRSLAALHATYWESPRLDSDLRWLDRPDDSVTVRFWQRVGPRLVRRHLESGARAEVVDRSRWSEDRMWAAFERLQQVNSGRPRTVLHGDVHAGNVYYLDGGRGGLLDWQLMLQGSWALDVGYVLGTALEPHLRATHERDLLAGYLDELGRLGVAPPAFDDAWLAYRQQPIWGVMMWLITPRGVHTDLVHTVSLQRCLAAGDHLGTLEALGV
jgi:aminoglycoside phosphotransferase (APT) family kinase protein